MHKAGLLHQNVTIECIGDYMKVTVKNQMGKNRNETHWTSVNIFQCQILLSCTQGAGYFNFCPTIRELYLGRLWSSRLEREMPRQCPWMAKKRMKKQT